MTEEQIKQNALEYSGCSEEWFNDTSYVGESTAYDAHSFYDGAHSRDKEIEDLKFRLKDSQNVIRLLQSRIDELCHPWISVEERLPENNCVVFVSLNGTEYLSAHYRAKSKRFVTVGKDKQTLVEVRKSAATYTVCGDCIKEERLYSEGQREDITYLVTHWMLIPELNKEE